MWKWNESFEIDFILRHKLSMDTPIVAIVVGWPYRHYRDVITGTMASQITSLRIVYSTVYSGTDQRKHQSSASLAFVRGIHRWPVNSPHKGPVTRKMFPFDDVIMVNLHPLHMSINKSLFTFLVWVSIGWYPYRVEQVTLTLESTTELCCNSWEEMTYHFDKFHNKVSILFSLLWMG